MYYLVAKTTQFDSGKIHLKMSKIGIDHFIDIKIDYHFFSDGYYSSFR